MKEEEGTLVPLLLKNKNTSEAACNSLCTDVF